MTLSKYNGDKNKCSSHQKGKKKKHTVTISELPKHQKGETVEQPSSKIGVTSLNQLLFTPALLPGPHFQHPKQRAEVQHSKARGWNNKRYQFIHKHENGLVSLLILQHTAQCRGREGTLQTLTLSRYRILHLILNQQTEFFSLPAYPGIPWYPSQCVPHKG